MAFQFVSHFVVQRSVRRDDGTLLDQQVYRQNAQRTLLGFDWTSWRRDVTLGFNHKWDDRIYRTWSCSFRLNRGRTTEVIFLTRWLVPRYSSNLFLLTKLFTVVDILWVFYYVLFVHLVVFSLLHTLHTMQLCMTYYVYMCITSL